MTTMVAEIYDALREAGASEDKARRAAEALAGYDDRFGKLEQRMSAIEGRMIAIEARVASLVSELTSLKWVVSTMGGVIIAMQIAIFIKLFIHG